MAYNNAHPTSDTEVVLANHMELEDALKGNKDLNFVNDWLNELTVENEIWRGKKLREEKPVPDDTEYEYNVTNIDFLGSFVKQRRERKGRLKSAKNRTNPSTPRSKSPYPRPATAASTYLPMNRILRTNTQRIRPKKSKKCSMRIAELAVPTKRQCIDTWRNKSDVLPEFMVERLKQHVMDQRPIVKIPDAIYCFQQRRPQSSKICSFRFPPSKNENNYKVLKPCHQLYTRTLCIIFAQRIIERLSKPLNLTLNSHLENLSRVVSSDIAKIISKCKCTFMKNRKYKAIHTDVSNKITVWIADILEDLTLKLLEEDLRVKEENEINAKFSEQFVTLMETIIKQEQMIKSTDLEEEEGPVLDFIDDVVDNVMNICKPLPVDSESETSGFSKDALMEEKSEKLLTPIESTDNNMTKLEEIFNIQEATQILTEETDAALKDSNENLTDADLLRKEIYNIIDNITKDSNENSTDEDHLRKEIYNIIDNITKDSNENSTDEDLLRKEIYNIIDNIKESGDDISNGSGDGIESVNNEQISPEAEMEHDINEEDIDQIDDNSQNIEENEEVTNNADKNDLNVSEGFKILTEDSDGDKNSKKVILSITKLVNPDNLTEQIKTSTTEEPGNDKHKYTQWNPENFKSNIIFSEPNDHLLSDADESWPANLADTAMLKVSEIVSKSVLSLGNINENDEKQISSPGANMANKEKMSNTKLQVENNMKKLNDNMLPTEKQDIKSQSNKLLSKASKETTTIDPKTNVTQVYPSTLEEKGIGKSINGPKICDKPVDESSKEKINKTDSGECDLVTDPKTSVTQVDPDTHDEKGIGKSISGPKICDKPVDESSKEEKNKTDSGECDLVTDPKTSLTQVDPETHDEKGIGKSISGPKICDKPVDESSKNEKNKTDSGESDLVRTGSTAGRTEYDKIPGHKTQSQNIDFGWKVYPESAPAWVTSWGQGSGEPSEDSIPIQTRPTKVSQSEMCKWCKDLENAFLNLEMWRHWITSTCKETIFLLKDKERACPSLAKRGAINWIRLKRNIHKEAILWTKLYQRTEKNFKSLKINYTNVEFSSNKPTRTVLNNPIFETMSDFENCSVETHKMIVAAEYRAICTCNKSKTRNIT